MTYLTKKKSEMKSGAKQVLEIELNKIKHWAQAGAQLSQKKLRGLPEADENENITRF